MKIFIRIFMRWAAQWRDSDGKSWMECLEWNLSKRNFRIEPFAWRPSHRNAFNLLKVLIGKIKFRNNFRNSRAAPKLLLLRALWIPTVWIPKVWIPNFAKFETLSVLAVALQAKVSRNSVKLSELLKSRLKSKVFRGSMRKVMAVVAKSPDIDSHQAAAFERLRVMSSVLKRL